MKIWLLLDWGFLNPFGFKDGNPTILLKIGEVKLGTLIGISTGVTNGEEES
jgi:hypothetical protein